MFKTQIHIDTWYAHLHMVPAMLSLRTCWNLSNSPEGETIIPPPVFNEKARITHLSIFAIDTNSGILRAYHIWKIWKLISQRIKTRTHSNVTVIITMDMLLSFCLFVFVTKVNVYSEERYSDITWALSSFHGRYFTAVCVRNPSMTGEFPLQKSHLCEKGFNFMTPLHIKDMQHEFSKFVNFSLYFFPRVYINPNERSR